jgi:hypothetical protein
MTEGDVVAVDAAAEGDEKQMARGYNPVEFAFIREVRWRCDSPRALFAAGGRRRVLRARARAWRLPPRAETGAYSAAAAVRRACACVVASRRIGSRIR